MELEETTMAKLKLGPILDEKPVKITAELPAAIHRDLLSYADALGQETGQTVEPGQLVAPMLARFMASDRGFARSRRIIHHPRPQPASVSASGSARDSENV